MSMQQQELLDKLDAAVLIPDRKKAKEAIAGLLQQACAEDLCLFCAGVTDPTHPGQCTQAYIDVGSRRYYTMFTKTTCFNEFDVPGVYKLSLLGIRCKEILEEIHRRKALHGITINPVNNDVDCISGFIMRKSDLPKPTEDPPTATP